MTSSKHKRQSEVLLILNRSVSFDQESSLKLL